MSPLAGRGLIPSTCPPNPSRLMCHDKKDHTLVWEVNFGGRKWISGKIIGYFEKFLSFSGRFQYLSRRISDYELDGTWIRRSWCHICCRSRPPEKNERALLLKTSETTWHRCVSPYGRYIALDCKFACRESVLKTLTKFKGIKTAESFLRLAKYCHLPRVQTRWEYRTKRQNEIIYVTVA